MTTDRIANLRERIGGPQAITWASFVILAPLAQFANFNRFTGSISNRISFMAFSLVLYFVIIAIARQLFKLRKPGTTSPLFLVFVVYGFIGAWRGIVTLLGKTIGWLPDQTIDPAFLLQGIIGSIVLLSLIAIAMDALHRQQLTVDELETQATQLTALRASASDELTAFTNQLQQTITTQIVPSLTSSRNSLIDTKNAGATPTQLRTTADQIRSTVQSAVQMLSRELTVQPATNIAKSPHQKLTRPLRFWEIVRSLVASDPFAPMLNAFLVFLLFLGISINRAGALTGLLTAVAMFVVTLVLLAISQRLLSRITRLRTLCWLLMTIVVGLLTGITNNFVLGLNDVSIQQTVVTVIFLQIWCGVVIATIKAASNQLSLSTESLEATNDSYQRETEGLQQAVTALQHRVASVLHGDVQGRLVANALRLDLAADDEQADRVAAINEVVGEIDELQTHISTITDLPINQNALRTNLDVIAAQWTGLVDIKIGMTGKGAERLTVVECSAITEVIREGINNAAKHAAATKINVQIYFSTDNVEISVTDNGVNKPKISSVNVESFSRNLSLELDQNSLRRVGDQTLLRVVIPLSSNS